MRSFEFTAHLLLMGTLVVRYCTFFCTLFHNALLHVSLNHFVYLPNSGVNGLLCRITRQKQTLEDMLATWLLFIVPLVVVGTTGGIMSEVLETVNASYTFLTLVFSLVSLSIGLTLTFMVVTMYLLRLITYGVPPKESIVSTLIPLGPFGQVSPFSTSCRIPRARTILIFVFFNLNRVVLALSLFMKSSKALREHLPSLLHFFLIPLWAPLPNSLVVL
jgi:tellurite resistance protein TehA-like permease